MYLHTACCNRKNVPAVQNTLPLAVAAIAARCVAHVSSRRWVCLPDLSSRGRVSSADLSLGGVLARPRVFATTWVFARPVFEKCLRPCMCPRTCLRAPTCLRDDTCPRPTCLSGRVFGRPRVLATACLRRTCLRQLSSRTHMVSLL